MAVFCLTAVRMWEVDAAAAIAGLSHPARAASRSRVDAPVSPSRWSSRTTDLSLEDRRDERAVRASVAACPTGIAGRVQKWLELLRIETSPSLSDTLSGGMRQRVAIARALR